jgi:hypothetical protein
MNKVSTVMLDSGCALTNEKNHFSPQNCLKIHVSSRVSGLGVKPEWAFKNIFG